MTALNESVVEEATIDWFEELGYQTFCCSDVSAVAPTASYTV